MGKNLYEKYKSNFSSRIRKAKICPYCRKKTEYIDSQLINKNYGMIYYCKDCNAYVGVHHRTGRKPYGRLANSELRKLKIETHRYFDILWKKAMEKKGYSKYEARKKAYQWLSKELGIPEKFTHIGMFNEPICIEAINLCKNILRKIK